VGGAASVLSARRAIALAALLAALVVYCATAERLPTLPDGLDVAFMAMVVLPAFAAAIWLALPLARARELILLGLAAVSAVAAVVLTAIDAVSGANVSKLATYGLLGFAFVSLFEELWWITLVAVIVPWVDVWSVAAGPTQYVIDQQPGFFEQISVALPSLGQAPVLNVGPPDILFFALFLAAADRFGLRPARTWAGMTALLAATLVLVWVWEDVSGLPALPAICLGFLLPNADLLLRDVRRERARAS
jgi:hypothetical protein